MLPTLPPPPTACVACGYALVGLDPASDCPECRHPVAASAAAQRLLRFADRAWLASVARGAQLLVIAARLQLLALLLLLVMVLAVSAPATWPAGPIAAVMSGLIYSAIALSAACTLLLAVGCWFLASPEASGALTPRWLSLACRAPAIAFPVVGYSWVLFVQGFSSFVAPGVSFSPATAAVVARIWELVGIVLAISTLELLRRLRRRTERGGANQTQPPGFTFRSEYILVLAWLYALARTDFAARPGSQGNLFLACFMLAPVFWHDAISGTRNDLSDELSVAPEPRKPLGGGT